MPLAAPVTKATFPVNSLLSFVFTCCSFKFAPVGPSSKLQFARLQLRPLFEAAEQTLASTRGDRATRAQTPSRRQRQLLNLQIPLPLPSRPAQGPDKRLSFCRPTPQPRSGRSPHDRAVPRASAD